MQMELIEVRLINKVFEEAKVLAIATKECMVNYKYT